MEQKGIYKISCSCSPNAAYVGETHVCFKTRMKQHRDGVASYDPARPNAANVSGITKHYSECASGTVDWEQPEILATFQEKNKNKLKKNLIYL